jgi:protoporphyrinogen oxidase
MTQLVILGGGVAGLAAGMYAHRHHMPACVLEAGNHVGGNARTLTHGAFRFDTGAHRFHDRYPDVTAEIRKLLGDELLEVAAPSQICWHGRMLDFPLTPINACRTLGFRISARAVWDLAAAQLSRTPANASFERIATKRYGRTLAELFLLGYSRKLWGVPCDRLLPSVAGRRLQGLSARMLFRELRGRRQARPAHLEGRFYYPKRGIGTIADRLAESCGPGTIRTNARVTRLVHEQSRIVQIEINGGETIDTSAARVISTLPPALVVRLLSPGAPDEVLDAARGLRFRNVVLVTVILDASSVSSNATIYFPESEYVFTRASEPKNRSADMAPPGHTSLSLEIPCWFDDEVWTAPDADVVARCVTDLRRTGLVGAGTIVDTCVHRLPSAYPVLEAGTEGRTGTVTAFLSRFDNLHATGRVGRFSYVHLHDLIHEAGLLVDLARRDVLEPLPYATDERPPHSARNASRGSMRAARRAGT